MRSFTWDIVCKRRLSRNSLFAPAPSSQLVEVVRRVGGIQAQVFSAAELAIGARVTGMTRLDVQMNVWDQHRLIKTYGPRGTLHLLPADELTLWMAALYACMISREAPWYVAAGLQPAQADILLEAIGDVLDGQCLTRVELAEEVAQRVGSWAKECILPIKGDFLGPAALTGRLCFGPNRGNHITYVRPDQWADCGPAYTPDEALIAICRRYIAAYGPVTHQDFARWLGFKASQARGVMASLTDELEEVMVEGQRAWIVRDENLAEESWVSDLDSLRLLPQYDCYVLGCGPRSGVLPDAARARVSTYGRGRIEGAAGLPVLLVNGVIAGIWDRRKRGKKIELQVELFDQLSPAHLQLLEAEASRLGTFLGAETTLTLATLE